jgi:pimeloyl-ACP methyl ester carboxylesterase
MQEDFNLRADIAPVELDQSGLTLIAPGLLGTGAWHSRREPGEMRAFTGEKNALDRGLAEAGLEDRHTLIIEAPTPQVSMGAVRGAGGVSENELLLQVPLADKETAFVMYTDEAGIVSFHYRDSGQAVPALPSRSWNAARQDRFRISLRPGTSRAPGEGRALFGRLLAKIIKVIVVELFPDEVGNAAAKRVKLWEDKNRRAIGFHGGNWQQLLDDAPLALTDVASLTGKKSLLFLHGTTSSTAGAFGALRGFPQLLDRLRTAYDGRVAGFNHHTMTAGVAENVRDVYAALASAPGDYTFDVVCHSRGGLVALALTQLADASFEQYLGSPWRRPAGVNIKIDRIVFVATPNAGTDLAIPDNISSFIERLVNFVNMLPDSAGTIAIGALLSVAAAVAEVTLPRLPGLADQSPDSDLLRKLLPADTAERYFAFQASYAPTGDLFDVVRNAAMDRIFSAKQNDLVVPTEGVSAAGGFKLPVERIVQFGPNDGVYHTNFFSQPAITKIAEFLNVD